MAKNFAITGVGGYIAPRHLQAIKATGNNLIAALDPHDAVGIMDQYFPYAYFFTEPERFDRHLEKLKRAGDGNKVDYISICSPNYLHDAHIRMALRLDANAICEKPLVLNPANLDLLKDIEAETGKKVFNVLQLRLHPAMVGLKEKFVKTGNRAQIELTYVTSRGNWYLYSWKGNEERSGGLASNIGIHFFDMLLWIFGKMEQNLLFYSDPKTQSGYIQLEHADVRWFLSIDEGNLPKNAKESGKRTYRSIKIDGNELEFSEGFADLHTKIYENVLANRGFGIDDAREAIKLVYNLRYATPVSAINNQKHPYLFL